MKEKIQEIQPIHWTGAIRHCGLWLTGTSEDIVYNNPNYKPQEDASETSAIYCVSGTADYNKSFSLLANRLIANLPNTISSIHLLAFSHRFEGLGIEGFATELAEKIKANGHKTVFLMGHSRGGVVCAYYNDFLAVSFGVTVKKVFAICAPFNGSELAMAPLTLLSKSVEQMQTGSAFLKNLQASMRLNKGKYVFFAAENDYVVPQQSTYVPELSDNLIILTRHGHLSIMSSNRLADVILKNIWGILPSLSIKTVCEELDEYLKQYRKKEHWTDSSAKLIVLEQLQTFLHSVEASPSLLDSETQTIGELVHQFLSDEKRGNGQRPYDILNKSLNFPSFYNSATFDFISGLITRYNTVPVIQLKALDISEVAEKANVI